MPVDTLYPCCAGLDIHKETVVACVRKAQGGKVQQEVRTFHGAIKFLREV